MSVVSKPDEFIQLFGSSSKSSKERASHYSRFFCHTTECNLHRMRSFGRLRFWTIDENTLEHICTRTWSYLIIQLNILDIVKTFLSFWTAQWPLKLPGVSFKDASRGFHALGDILFLPLCVECWRIFGSCYPGLRKPSSLLMQGFYCRRLWH